MAMPTYVILGATGGIGSSLCQRLAGHANLVLAAREESRLQALREQLEQHRGDSEVMIQSLDARKSEQVDQLATQSVERFGSIQGAVCLVGSIHLKPIHTISDEDFEETLYINLRTAFNLTRASTRAMMNSGGGSIVLMSTVATQVGLMNHDAISAAKAAINGLVISVAASYASRGIRVNAIAPGLVDTPLSKRITSNELSLKASVAMHPLGRIGQPEDVATPIAWLLGSESSWVTGQIIGVDGGLGRLRTR